METTSRNHERPSEEYKWTARPESEAYPKDARLWNSTMPASDGSGAFPIRKSITGPGNLHLDEQSEGDDDESKAETDALSTRPEVGGSPRSEERESMESRVETRGSAREDQGGMDERTDLPIDGATDVGEVPERGEQWREEGSRTRKNTATGDQSSNMLDMGDISYHRICEVAEGRLGGTLEKEQHLVRENEHLEDSHSKDRIKATYR
jgi:hypothetical protein